MKEKYITYIRTSHKSQSLEYQRNDMRRYCEMHGYDYVMYEEQESTRKTRPIKQEVMALLRTGKYKGAIVFSFDRWSRNVTELLLDMEYFIKNDIEFISIKEALNLSTSMGKLQFHVISMFSEYQREQIKQKCQSGMEDYRKRNKGKWGRPKGSKDKKPRSTEGYYLREQRKREARDNQINSPQIIEGNQDV